MTARTRNPAFRDPPAARESRRGSAAPSPATGPVTRTGREARTVRRNVLAAAAAVLLGLTAASCGGDDGGGSAGSGSGDTGSGSGGQVVKNAKVIDIASMNGAKGKVTYCTGKDTTGETKEWSKQFNAKYKAQGLRVEIFEFPASADEQRQQFVQRQEAKAADCDVFRSDVIWTAEFA